MDHQNWTPIVFNNLNNSNNSGSLPKLQNSDNDDIEIKTEVPKHLCKLISQARTARNKTQKGLASELGISYTILNTWESGKEIPTNNDIAKLEKHLGIKLPRTKKIKERT
jgi:ribosome-binding protein aMBF1 (putative translation factor)